MTEEERERESAIRPQPVVDAEAMETVSNHEEENEHLGPEDDDEVTGKQKKEKYEYDAAIEQRLVEFFSRRKRLLLQHRY